MNFEQVFLRLLKIAYRPNDISIGMHNITEVSKKRSYYEFYVYDIYLDDTDESDEYSFSWEIGKTLDEQSQETKQTLAILFYEPNS